MKTHKFYKEKTEEKNNTILKFSDRLLLLLQRFDLQTKRTLFLMKRKTLVLVGGESENGPFL